MSRTTSLILYGLFGFFVVIPIGFVLMIEILIPSGPDPERLLDNAQPLVDRIITALDQYHHMYRRYPQRLSELVDDCLLTEIPTLPSEPGISSVMPPYYQANALLDFYQLSYGYTAIRGSDSDNHSRVYVSDNARGWTKGHPEIMQYMVADRLAAPYQKQHDAKSLERFMIEAIGKMECDRVFRDSVFRWLGEGTEIEVPPNLQATGQKGYVYQALDEPGKRYCLVYKDHWLKQLRSYLTANERAKYPVTPQNRNDPFVDYNDPTLDTLFLVVDRDNQPTWTVLRKCPPSRFDKPPANPD